MRTLITASERARSLARAADPLHFYAGAGCISKRVITGPGSTETTSCFDTEISEFELQQLGHGFQRLLRVAAAHLRGRGSSSRSTSGSSPVVAAEKSRFCVRALAAKVPVVEFLALSDSARFSRSSSNFTWRVSLRRRRRCFRFPAITPDVQAPVDPRHSTLQCSVQQPAGDFSHRKPRKSGCGLGANKASGESQERQAYPAENGVHRPVSATDQKRRPRQRAARFRLTKCNCASVQLHSRTATHPSPRTDSNCQLKGSARCVSAVRPQTALPPAGRRRSSRTGRATTSANQAPLRPTRLLTSTPLPPSQ